PPLIKRYQEAGVEVRGCPRTVKLAPRVKSAADSDWGTEFLDLILAVRVVDDMEQAMEHIVRYGSQHSEAIVTQDHGRAMRFLNDVDAAAVFVNASTRLHDGYQFGLGAEIGLSTTRIHARGAMGLEELTSAKFIVLGTGQLRELSSGYTAARSIPSIGAICSSPRPRAAASASTPSSSSRPATRPTSRRPISFRRSTGWRWCVWLSPRIPTSSSRTSRRDARRNPTR